MADEEEVWAIVDPCELRKPYARRMESLMKVHSLEEGKTVPGYRTLNVLGVGRGGRRGVLYHRLFSSREQGFRSESTQVQEALRSVGEALGEKRGRVTYIVDSGFDDIAVWAAVWEQGNHLVCRLKHRERLVEQGQGGTWQGPSVAQAALKVREMARLGTEMEVRKRGQRSAKVQAVEVVVSACRIRVSYQPGMREGASGEAKTKEVWLVEVRLEDTAMEPWLLLTDWPVEDEGAAFTVFRMYRQRWAVEDAFKFTKEVLGWAEVQLLNLEGVRTLVALGWVAAGFLYELGVSLEWPETRLLARLGAWEERPNRPPGKIILTRGLQRLLANMATNAILADEIKRYSALPPRIAALLGIDQPPSN
ncbi:MAG: transposase [Chloroflexota bacterium]